jgi:hypothetical protein
MLYRYVDGENSLRITGAIIPPTIGTYNNFFVLKTSTGYFAFNGTFNYIQSVDGINWNAGARVESTFAIHDAIVVGSKVMMTTQGATVTTEDAVNLTKLNHLYTGTNSRRLNPLGGNDIRLTATMGTNTQTVAYAVKYDGALDFVSRVPFMASGNQFAAQAARKANHLIFGSITESMISTSLDNGATWTQRYLGGSGYNICSLTYSARLDMFLMVPYGGTSPTAHTTVYTSLDGVRWTPRVMPSSLRWNCVIECGNLLFALTGASGSTTWAYSQDGIRWIQISTPVGSDWNFGIATDRSFVATGPTGGFTLGVYGRFYDPESEFQLPIYPFVLGQPSWFIKVK